MKLFYGKKVDIFRLYLAKDQNNDRLKLGTIEGMLRHQNIEQEFLYFLRGMQTQHRISAPQNQMFF
jgi:hypothetical protein